jgi:hypothetical protein
MRMILAASFVLAASLGAIAAPAPNFADMTQKQVQAFFANKTSLGHGRYGNSAMYFRPNGTIYLATAGSSRIEKNKWSVLYGDNRWQVCLASISSRIAEAKFTSSFCVEAREFVRESDDQQSGDLLKLSSGKLKIDLGTKRTTLAKLLGGRR